MSSTKFTKRNLNRYRKVYPYIRRDPLYALISDNAALLEVGSVDFVDVSSKTYTFTESFPSAPVVTATSVDSSSTNNADVNVFVSSLTTTSMTIETSQKFTGTVDFHAIWIQC